MTVGVNHEPIKAVATTENNVATYSVGTGAGRALKFAVKPPNFVILMVASALSRFMCKKSKMESKTDGGGRSVINWSELNSCVNSPAN